jgi:cytochrome c biogenesis protein CcmG/thiol:disulfide interchange protein DsbE
MAARVKLGAQALAVAAVLALLALLIWRVAHGNGRTATPKNFTLSRLDRPGRLELASLRGKVVVLNFWASWCIPCKQEAQTLEAAWQRYRLRGVVVLGVDVNDFSGDARNFMRRYGITYPVVHDGSGSTVGPYGILAFPETRFVDRNGKFVGKHIYGAVTARSLATNIRAALRS